MVTWEAATIHKYELWLQTDELTPEKLSKMSDKIVDSLEEDIQLFRREFPEYTHYL